MTSAQLLPSGTGRLLLVLLWVIPDAGCVFFHDPLTPPAALQNSAAQTRLWAVAPFANESGVSIVDTFAIADAFTQQLEQVEGIDTVAVNRVVQAMRAAGMPSVSTHAEALRLLEMLDVDALVVGTVTAFDPYPPPTLGMAVQAFTRPGREARPAFDPQALVRAPSGAATAPGELGAPQAAAQAAGVFDARNHQTLTWLAQYAAGRTEPDSAFGADVYLMDMELYTQFVSYRLIHDLLDSQRSRQQPVEVATRR